MDLAEDRQEARHNHKRARTSDPDDSDEDISGTNRLVPDASSRRSHPQAPTPPTGGVATATATAPQPATNPQFTFRVNRTLAASIHAPSTSQPLSHRAPTAAAAEECLRQAADRATAVGNATAPLFTGIIQSLKDAEALGAVTADAARLFRAAAIAAARTDAAPSVDPAAFDRLATSLETWLTSTWNPPPAPTPPGPGPSPAAAPRPGNSDSPSSFSSDSFPPLPQRASATGTHDRGAATSSRRTAPSRPPTSLRGMVVEGGGKNSAYNIAQQGGRKDNRVFLRLAHENEARKLSERTLCLKLNKALEDAGVAAHARVKCIHVQKCWFKLSRDGNKGSEVSLELQHHSPSHHSHV
ncbi:hypothetical protein CF326_g9027 [Tilletia indica]|nr:hypothetical protein CF326_g9027 [Tilletia indica]